MRTRAEFVTAWLHRYRTDPAIKGRCFYCGRLMNKNKRSPFQKTKEHLYPQHSHKGMLHNAVRACYGCNGGKCGASIDTFREYVGEEFFCEKVLGCIFPRDGSRLGDGEFYAGVVALSNHHWQTKIDPIVTKLCNTKQFNKKIRTIIYKYEEGSKCRYSRLQAQFSPLPSQPLPYASVRLLLAKHLSHLVAWLEGSNPCVSNSIPKPQAY